MSSSKKDLLLGLAAVVTAVATILTAVIGPEGLIGALTLAATDKPAPAVVSTAVPVASSTACRFFDDFRDVLYVELEDEATFKLPADYDESNVIAIRLLDSETFAFMGGVKMRYSERTQRFTVLTAVNGRCEALVDFEKSYTYGNGESFPLTVGTQGYMLQFSTFTHEIKIRFTKQPPV